jgi:hypothetical protein
MAAKYHKPVLVVCGQNGLEEIPTGSWIRLIRSLHELYDSPAEALSHAYEGLIRLTKEILSLI